LLADCRSRGPAAMLMSLGPTCFGRGDTFSTQLDQRSVFAFERIMEIAPVSRRAEPFVQLAIDFGSRLVPAEILLCPTVARRAACAVREGWTVRGRMEYSVIGYRRDIFLRA
jgi:hypothetical protein